MVVETLERRRKYRIVRFLWGLISHGLDKWVSGSLERPACVHAWYFFILPSRPPCVILRGVHDFTSCELWPVEVDKIRTWKHWKWRITRSFWKESQSLVTPRGISGKETGWQALHSSALDISPNWMGWKSEMTSCRHFTSSVFVVHYLQGWVVVTSELQWPVGSAASSQRIFKKVSALRLLKASVLS